MKCIHVPLAEMLNYLYLSVATFCQFILEHHPHLWLTFGDALIFLDPIWYKDIGLLA
jgi:hypothetical protein